MFCRLNGLTFKKESITPLTVGSCGKLDPVVRFAGRRRSSRSGGFDEKGQGLAPSKMNPFKGSAVHDRDHPQSHVLVPAVPNDVVAGIGLVVTATPKVTVRKSA